MLKGNWRYIIAAIGLAAAIAGSGVWVYYLDNPVTHQTGAQQHDGPASPVTPPAQRIASALEAIEKGENSYQNEEHARRDLDAQEGAWRWAKWAVWVAAVQALLSGIGIAFVVQSLRQGQAGLSAARRALRHARVANEIARETMRKQLRAYLGVEGVRIDRSVDSSRPMFIVGIKNFGPTPAQNVAVTITVGYHRNPAEANIDRPLEIEDCIRTLNPNASYLFEGPCPFRLSPENYEIIKQGQGVVVAFGGIRYDDVFGERHETRFCYLLDQHVKADGMLRYHRDGNRGD